MFKIKKFLLAICFAVMIPLFSAPVVMASASASASANEPAQESVESTDSVDMSSESVEDTSSDETNEGTEDKTEKPDFDAFLAWAQEQADTFGYGNEFKQAIDAIKTAATQEQVTLSTIGSIAVAAVTLVYVIVQKIKDKKTRSDLVKLLETAQKQVKGTNDLIDEANTLDAVETETKKEVEQVKSALKWLISA
ncbi:MAG: hypothetical protein IJY38_03280, partial [Clostridia bacterium]|nr:hypothetical protein [Clostridia bacterium]